MTKIMQHLIQLITVIISLTVAQNNCKDFFFCGFLDSISVHLLWKKDRRHWELPLFSLFLTWYILWPHLDEDLQVSDSGLPGVDEEGDGQTGRDVILDAGTRHTHTTGIHTRLHIGFERTENKEKEFIHL